MAKNKPGGRAPRSRGQLGRLVRTLLILLLVIGFVGPVLAVAVYRFAPPPVTFLMIQRLAEGRGLNKSWRGLDQLSPHLVRSAIASEDANFCGHRGFDLEAIRKAMDHNERSDRVRGGSTISQQTAKNVFLWPDRSYVRKGLEAYFTVLIEVMWGKPRIMEVYLNVAEFGPGIYGAEAAARRYFGVSAADLSPTQAARLVAVLPSPLRYKVVEPGPYVRRRTGRIQAAAGTVRRDGLAACVLG
ncbi:monofunctional biosynthetic peptidoglycan transglycosylase [Phenylobacterium sp.]|uniref:monofunctional biosynthetic peptidoglycan transglycosylase n=1 Tax=Phenylobacterium sp. TaxID=1871053 RepID=UPI002FD9430C